eukprot:jgi/Mesvir1/24963/Mv16933-RA.1
MILFSKQGLALVFGVLLGSTIALKGIVHNALTVHSQLVLRDGVYEGRSHVPVDPTDRPCAPSDDPLDCQALSLLAREWSFDRWRNSSGWLSSNSYCTWAGVTCSPTGRVSGLSLPNQGLTGVLSSSLYLLSELSDLNLSHNLLTGSIPPEIGRLEHLVSLYLWGNNLWGTVPLEIGNLKRLRYLSLNYNDLVGTIPESVGRLRKLVRLYLEHNRLSGTIPLALGLMPELTRVHLDDNRLSGIIPPTLASLPKLSYLYLDGNHLEYLPPLFCASLASEPPLPGHFDLRGNPLECPLPKECGAKEMATCGIACAGPAAAVEPPGEAFTLPQTSAWHPSNMVASVDPYAGFPTTCIDDAGSEACAQWKGQGMCEVGASDRKGQGEDLTGRCRSTCGACRGGRAVEEGEVEECAEDTVPSCKTWARNGNCRPGANAADFMRVSCGRSCALYRVTASDGTQLMEAPCLLA